MQTKTLKKRGYSKTFQRHMAELKRGLYGEGFINGIKKSLNNNSRKSLGLSIGKSFSGMSLEELEQLLDYIATEHPRIRKEQAKKGITWLRNQARTPKGKERKTNPFKEYELSILDNFSHFLLVGFIDIGHSGFSNYLPIYRVVSKSGNSFEYFSGSWQSGIKLEIV